MSDTGNLRLVRNQRLNKSRAERRRDIDNRLRLCAECAQEFASELRALERDMDDDPLTGNHAMGLVHKAQEAAGTIDWSLRGARRALG